MDESLDIDIDIHFAILVNYKLETYYINRIWRMC